jgi:hypothetical protein
MLRSKYFWTPHLTIAVPIVAISRVWLTWSKRIRAIHPNTMWTVEACPTGPEELAVLVARTRGWARMRFRHF